MPKGAPYRRYLVASYAENTRRAYETDVSHFKRWGGRIPATPEQLSRYLAFYAGRLAYATLSRRISAIHREHAARGLPSPARSELVRATLRGIGRTYSRKQRQVRPLLNEHLRRMLRYMRGSAGIRDRALLLLGFFGGFRRSELSALNTNDLDQAPWGLSVVIRRSKTDQEGIGRRVKIPRVKSALCAVRALKTWLKQRAAEGPLFVRVTPSGKATSHRISGYTIAQIIKRRAGETGLNPEEFSGHSLRAGFITAAAKAGAATWQIKQQTGHKSDAALARYIRGGDAVGVRVARLVGKR